MNLRARVRAAWEGLTAGEKAAPVLTAKAASAWYQVLEETLTQNLGSAWIAGKARTNLISPLAQHLWFSIGARKVAEAAATVPLRFRMKEGGKKDEVTKHPAVDLFRFVNEEWDFNLLIAHTILYLIGVRDGGNCLWVLWPSKGMESGLSGSLPGAIYAFGKAGWSKRRDTADGRLVSFDYPARGWRIPPERMVHHRFASTDSIDWGASPTDAAWRSMQTDLKAQGWNDTWFEKGMNPSMNFSTDQRLGKEEFDRLLKQLQEEFTGIDNNGAPIVTHSGVKVSSLGATAKDSDFVEQQRQGQDAALAVTGTPKGVLGLNEGLTYNIIWGQKRIFWQEGVTPLLTSICNRINGSFCARYCPELEAYFDYSGIPEMSEDLGVRTDTASKLRTLGYPLGEINRRLELGMEQTPWDNEAWLPISMLTRTTENPFPEDPSPSADAPKMAQVRKGSKRATQTWVGWNRKVRVIEGQMTGKIRKWVYGRRSALLANLPAAMKTCRGLVGKSGPADYWPDSEEGIRELFRLVTPVEVSAVRLGTRQAQDALGVSVQVGTLDAIERQILSDRLKGMAKVAKDTAEKVRGIVADGVEKGDGEQDIADAVRAKFNEFSEGWARVVARTESHSASNGATFQVYEKEGAEKIEWVTCRDQDVRESHAGLDGVVVKMGEEFENGLRYPHDDSGEAGEVVNCRCTFIVAE